MTPRSHREHTQITPRSHPDHTQITRMQATEITDAGIAALKSKRYDVCRINYANPDMVGP